VSALGGLLTGWEQLAVAFVAVLLSISKAIEIRIVQRGGCTTQEAADALATVDSARRRQHLRLIDPRRPRGAPEPTEDDAPPEDC